MRIAALDLGARYIGWAVGEDDQIPNCGTVEPENRDNQAAFACSYFDWWARFLTAEQPAEVAVEGGTPIMTIKQPDIAERMMAVLTATRVLCYRRNIPLRLTNVGTIRKAVVGTGRADDALIMQAMVEMGCRPRDSHAADACAAWMHRAGRKWRPARAAA